MEQYFIGQRVIIDGKEIAVVIPYPTGTRNIERETCVWVRRINGIEQFRSFNNVKPLPNGQL